MVQEKIQHYMSYHPDLNQILIDNYKRERFLTCMLVDCVYVTRSLNWVYGEVIDNIKC